MTPMLTTVNNRVLMTCNRVEKTYDRAGEGRGFMRQWGTARCGKGPTVRQRSEVRQQVDVVG